MSDHFHSPSASRPGRDAVAVLVLALALCVVFAVLAARAGRPMGGMMTDRPGGQPPLPLRDPPPKMFPPELIS